MVKERFQSSPVSPQGSWCLALSYLFFTVERRPSLASKTPRTVTLLFAFQVTSVAGAGFEPAKRRLMRPRR